MTTLNVFIGRRHKIFLEDLCDVTGRCFSGKSVFVNFCMHTLRVEQRRYVCNVKYPRHSAFLPLTALSPCDELSYTDLHAQIHGDRPSTEV